MLHGPSRVGTVSTVRSCRLCLASGRLSHTSDSGGKPFEDEHFFKIEPLDGLAEGTSR